LEAGNEPVYDPIWGPIGALVKKPFTQTFLQSRSEDTMIVVGWQSINHFKKAGLTSLLSISILWQMLRYFPLIEMIDFQVGVLGDG
jgi:hypothetical protein